jgi:hypothetical protein
MGARGYRRQALGADEVWAARFGLMHAEAYKRQREKEQREKLEREHYGLSWEQRLAAAALSSDTVRFLIGVAEQDGIGISRLSRELARLANIGFLSIEANGRRHSVAKLTMDGMKALVCRLAQPRGQASR